MTTLRTAGEGEGGLSAPVRAGSDRRNDQPGRPARSGRPWVGRRSAVLMGLVSLVGMLAFSWPFFVSADSALAHAGDAPWLFAAVMTLLGLSVLAEQSSGGLDAKTIAMLGVLAALGGCLRLLSAGTAGLEPVYFLVVVAGRVLGRRLAFLGGALILLLGAFLTGGIGPWAPFQMIVTGWVALGAALLPAVTGRAEVVMLAGYGLLAGFGYGVVMNLWFWPFLGTGAPAGAGFVPGAELTVNLGRYLVFYLATSLAWDLPRGLLTAVLILAAGRVTLATLRRAMRRAAFDAEVSFR